MLQYIKFEPVFGDLLSDSEKEFRKSHRDSGCWWFYTMFWAVFTNCFVHLWSFFVFEACYIYQVM